MTRASTTHTQPEPKRTPPTPAATDFDKPDAAQAAEGAPEHEQGGGTRQQDDARHGYSQDSGYQGSGGSGNEAPGRKRERTAVSEESRTPFDKDASDSPRR